MFQYIFWQLNNIYKANARNIIWKSAYIPFLYVQIEMISKAVKMESQTDRNFHITLMLIYEDSGSV